MNKYADISESARDVLMEIGNIGTGNAVTALSSMINHRIEIERPNVKIMKFEEVPAMLGGPEEIKLGVLLELSGDLNGMFMFLISTKFAQTMLDKLLGTEIEDVRNLDDMSLSAVCEIGNIMCCSYINAMTVMMDLRVHVSVPDICIDMTGAILSVPMIHFARLSDELLLIEDKYHFDDQEVVSHILFLPEIHSLERIFKALGEEYEG